MPFDQLSPHQLEAFDSEYVNDERWGYLAPLITDHFGDDPEITVLDVGGGNGVFADRVLAAFPKVQALVLEPSRTLLDRNRPHPRKQCIEGGVERLDSLDGRPDLICFNWVLHHLVRGGYRETRRHIQDVLERAGSLLDPSGRISVFENNYNGAPIDDLPGWLTYRALRTPGVHRLAGNVGANTAGVGVCFLSRRGWHRSFRRAGLELVSDREGPARLPDFLERNRWARRVIALSEGRIGHYWLRGRSPG